MSNPQTEAVELSARTCRYCREPYVAPKGSRPHACRRCAPTIDDALNGAEDRVRVEQPRDAIPSAPLAGLELLDASTGRTYALPDDGIPF